MPVLCYRKKLKIDTYEENLSFAFNCAYDDDYFIVLKDCVPNDFESCNIRISIDEATDKLNNDILMEYTNKNGGIRYLAILNYFYDHLPGLYSIKYESSQGDSIYYVSDLKNK